MSLPTMSRMLRLARYIFQRSPRRAAVALVLMLLGSLTEGVTIFLVIPVLQLLGPGGTTVDLAFLARWFPSVFTEAPRLSIEIVLGILVVVVTLQSLFNRARLIYSGDVLYDIMSHIRTALFSSVAHARWRYVSSSRGSTFQHALTSEVDRFQLACGATLTLIQDLVLLAGYLVLSLFISVPMTALAFVAGLAVLIVLGPSRRHSLQHGQTLTRSFQHQHHVISEFLGGLKLAKSYNAEDRYVSSLNEHFAALRHSVRSYIRSSSISTVAFQVSGALVLSVFVLVGLHWLALPMPSLVVLVLLYARIASRFSAVQQDAQLILVNLSAFETLESLVAETDRERDEPEAAGRPAPLLTREVTFSDVSFQYGETSRSTLHRLSFRIPALQVTALIGPSGSGKSTIADILLGLLQPDSGDVIVDGTPLSQCSRRLWRDQTAYVPQEVFLINDTVRANLAFGTPHATQEQMWRALEEARADVFVKRMPDGLDTVLGDRGILVSGGERQRIALARALIRQPRLLILDEATSAIDWENQALIAQSLQDLRGRLTIVTIAHRISMIAFADWVVALDDGKIVEQGSYRALMTDPASRLSQLVSGETEGLR